MTSFPAMFLPTNLVFPEARGVDGVVEQPKESDVAGVGVDVALEFHRLALDGCHCLTVLCAHRPVCRQKWPLKLDRRDCRRSSSAPPPEGGGM